MWLMWSWKYGKKKQQSDLTRLAYHSWDATPLMFAILSSLARLSLAVRLWEVHF